jgi:hypothetical protein
MDIQSDDENKGQLYPTTRERLGVDDFDILRGQPPQINLGGVTADILARQERDRAREFVNTLRLQERQQRERLGVDYFDILRGHPPQINLGGVTADILARQERDRAREFVNTLRLQERQQRQLQQHVNAEDKRLQRRREQHESEEIIRRLKEDDNEDNEEKRKLRLEKEQREKQQQVETVSPNSVMNESQNETQQQYISESPTSLSPVKISLSNDEFSPTTTSEKTSKIDIPTGIKICNAYNEYIEEIQFSASIMAETNTEYVLLREYCSIYSAPIYEYIQNIMCSLNNNVLDISEHDTNNTCNSLIKFGSGSDGGGGGDDDSSVGADKPVQKMFGNTDGGSEGDSDSGEDDSQATVDRLIATNNPEGSDTEGGSKKRMRTKKNRRGNQKRYVSKNKRTKKNKRGQIGGNTLNATICNGVSDGNLQSIFGLLKSKSEFSHDFGVLGPKYKDILDSIYESTTGTLLANFNNIVGPVTDDGSSLTTLISSDGVDIKEFINILNNNGGEWTFSIANMWLASQCNRFQDITFVKYKKLDLDRINPEALQTLNDAGYIYWFPESGAVGKSDTDVPIRPFLYINMDNSPVTKFMTLDMIKYTFKDNNIDLKVLMPLINSNEFITYMGDIPINGTTYQDVKFCSAETLEILESRMRSISYPAGVLDPSTHPNGKPISNFDTPEAYATETDSLNNDKLARLQQLQNCNHPCAYTSYMAMVDGIETFIRMFGSNLRFVPIGVSNEDGTRIETQFIESGDCATEIPKPGLQFISKDISNNYQGIEMKLLGPIESNGGGGAEEKSGDNAEQNITLFAGDSAISSISILVQLFNSKIPYNGYEKQITELVKNSPSYRFGKTTYETSKLGDGWVRLCNFAKAIIDGIPPALLENIISKMQMVQDSPRDYFFTQIVIAQKGLGDSLEEFYAKRMSELYKAHGFTVSLETTDKLVRDEMLGLLNSPVLSNNVGNRMPEELIADSTFFNQKLLDDNLLERAGGKFLFPPHPKLKIVATSPDIEQNTFTSVTTNLKFKVIDPMISLQNTLDKLLILLTPYIIEIPTASKMAGQAAIARSDQPSPALSSSSELLGGGGGGGPSQSVTVNDILKTQQEKLNSVVGILVNLNILKDNTTFESINEQIASKLGGDRDALVDSEVIQIDSLFKDIYDLLSNVPPIESIDGNSFTSENEDVRLTPTVIPIKDKLNLLDTCFKTLYASVKDTRSNFLIKSNIKLDFTPLNAATSLSSLFKKSNKLRDILNSEYSTQYDGFVESFTDRFISLNSTLETTLNSARVLIDTNKRPPRSNRSTINVSGNMSTEETTIEVDQSPKVCEMREELTQLIGRSSNLQLQINEKTLQLETISEALKNKQIKIKDTFNAAVSLITSMFSSTPSEGMDPRLLKKQLSKEISDLTKQQKITAKETTERNKKLEELIEKMKQKFKPPSIITNQNSYDMFKMAIGLLVEKSNSFISTVCPSAVFAGGGGGGGGMVLGEHEYDGGRTRRRKMKYIKKVTRLNKKNNNKRKNTRIKNKSTHRRHVKTRKN